MKGILCNNERERLASLRRLNNNRLQSVVQEVDTVLGKMKMNNITDANNLIYAGAVLAQELLGLWKTYHTAKREPWWKRRLSIFAEVMKIKYKIHTEGNHYKNGRNITKTKSSTRKIVIQR